MHDSNSMCYKCCFYTTLPTYLGTGSMAQLLEYYGTRNLELRVSRGLAIEHGSNITQSSASRLTHIIMSVAR